MSKFDGKRLPLEVFGMTDDIKQKLRTGWYSDDYFNTWSYILLELSKEKYKFSENISDLEGIVDVSEVEVGDIEVEMQVFTSRKGDSVIGGVDEALAILKECTGYYDEDGNFINTFNKLEVEAVQDGDITHYSGKKTEVKPVLKIRGRYRDFAILETEFLGVLCDATRVATNVYNVLVAANGKSVLFFPARFTHYRMQGVLGYAYWIAVQRYKYDHGKDAGAFVSTLEQGDWWGGLAGGTIAHASIASFLGNTPETMMQFARLAPTDKPRIVLCDFHNDCVKDTLETMDKMWEKYWELYRNSKYEEAKKYKLYGTRPDTSGNMRDKSIVPLYDKNMDYGVNPRLVQNLRNAIDVRWKEWIKKYNYEDGQKAEKIAKKWCEDIKISVTGGFNVEKIRTFEELGVPVDVYGVGSSLLENSSKTGTNNDFTADIVKVKINNTWYDLAKVGRVACDNEDLIKIQ